MTSASVTQLLPGLSDRVFDSQRVFRAVLGALARPGQSVRIATALCAPQPLDSASAALLLSLTDFETPVWLQEPREAVCRYIRFHCGAPIVERTQEARFALITDPLAAPDLDAFHPGEPEYPDRSTTLIVQVSGFESISGVTLTGPGVREAVHVSVDGLPPNFWCQWRHNHAQFPCGVDVVFTCGSSVMGLPRTSQVEG